MAVEFRETEWAFAPIGGSTLAAVADTVAGMDEAGKTEWFPSYVTTTTGSVVSGVTVMVKTKVTMPQWSGYADAAQSEKNEWDRFCAALRAHEEGHLNLITEQLSNVDRRLIGGSFAQAAQAWREALSALSSASDAYDSSTDHGRNQGTVIEIR